MKNLSARAIGFAGTTIRAVVPALACLCFLGFPAGEARAEAFTWFGAGSSFEWTDSNNWLPDTSYPGAQGTTDTAVFDYPLPQSQETILNTDIQVGSLAYLSSGYSLTLTSSATFTNGIAATYATGPDLENDGSLYFGGTATVLTLTGSGGGFFATGTAATLAVLGTSGTYHGTLQDGSGAPLSLTVGDGTHAASLTLAPAGTLSNYSGATLVNANATLVSGGANALSASSVHEIDGTLLLAGGSGTIGGLSGTGQVGLGGNTLTVNGGGSFGGAISGSGSLVKSGAGSTLVITGTGNSYAGDSFGVATTIRGGTLALTGGSIITGTGEMMVGWMPGDSGALVVNGGGNLSNYDGFIGYGAGATGTALVDGGTWSNALALDVGEMGSGSLTIKNGGLVTDSSSTVGAQAGSTGTALVSGGTWRNVSSLHVGSFGSGTLTIQDGGLVTSRFGYIADAGSSNGTVIVTNGTWNNNTGGLATTNLFVGGSGTGTLQIGSGGYLVSAAASIGDLAGGAGTVTVNGGTWVSSSYVIVGNSGTGTISITNGGYISDTYAVVGVGGPSSVTVDNGVWNSTGNVTVGFATFDEVSQTWISGTGALTVQNSGLASVSGTLFLSTAPASIGILNIGAYDLGAPTTAGTLATEEVLFGSGTGVINFNQTGSTAFGTYITGTGTIDQRGSGLTVLTGSNSYSGTTFVHGGTLSVANNSAAGSSAVVVTAGTFLIQSGVSLPNTVSLAGGSLAQQFAAGTQLSTVGAFHDALPGGVTTGAQLLGGVTSGSATLIASFSGSSSALNDTIRISDIFTFDGVPVTDIATGQTDTFVLQLSLASVTAGDFLGSLDSDTNEWVNAVDGNIGGSTPFFVNGAYNAADDFHLGYYGIDTTGNTVWAVVDQGGSFAVIAVPEPGTSALLILAAFGCLIRQWRVISRRA